MAEPTLRITLRRSVYGAKPSQRATARSLGLRRPHHTVSQPDRPEIRGMVARIAHMVEVRYAGDEDTVDVEPGQEPKGAGRPPAGGTVADEEVAELREAEEEALAAGENEPKPAMEAVKGTEASESSDTAEQAEAERNDEGTP